MTSKPFDELVIGDYIADMHYGVAQLHKRYTVVSHVQWEEPADSGRLDRPGFSLYLQSFGRTYTNKNLIVIGFADNSTLVKPVVIAGYCYDGCRSGIITLGAKTEVQS